MKKLIIIFTVLLAQATAFSQTLTDTQKINARATGYAIVASRNPGVQFSIIVVPWDGVNTLEYNANNQINSGWHAQAAVKGNYFHQGFDGSNFSGYSSVILSQEEFDIYKSAGTQWWIVCSTLPPFSEKVNFNNNVGIGTTDTQGYKLAVAGKIIAEEIKVAIQSNWPDHVFNEEYELATLSDVEAHIKENGHLKDIPTAIDIDENGITLGEMNAKLLLKIEELTLYLIKQNKDITELKNQVNHLHQENLKLNSKMKDILKTE